MIGFLLEPHCLLDLELDGLLEEKMNITTTAIDITIIPTATHILTAKTYMPCPACAGSGSMKIWDQYASSAGGGYRQIGICGVCKGTAWACTNG